MSDALILGGSSPRDRKAHAMRGLVLWTTNTEATVTTDPNMTWGAGAPNHTAPANSIYVRTDAADSDTLFYRNTDSAATWEAVVGSEVTDLLAADNAWTGTNDHSKSVTGTDELINADLSINHATQVGVAVDATTTQLTTARTGGSVAAFRGKTTSLAGDLNSVKYNTFEAAAPTDGGGTVLHQVLAQAAGYDVLIDLTQIASGEGDIVLKDNIADALTIREGATAYMTFVTSDGVEVINVFKALTSTALGTFVGLTNTSTFTQSANILHTTTQAASGTGLSSITSMTDATGSAIASKIAATQLTNAKTAGTSIAEELDLNGLAGDTAGATYLSQYLTVTANGGSAKYYARRLAAGFTAVDDFSLLNSGTALTLIRDNVAVAWGIYEAANAYLVAISSDGVEALDCYKTFKVDTIAEHTGTAGVTIDGLLIKDGAVVTNLNAVALIAVADAGGGGTTAALTVDLTRDDGSVVGAAVQIMISAALTQYAPNSALGSVTFGTATKGSIIASGSGWCLAQTSTGGEFDCTATNAVDEALFFSVAAPPTGQSDTTKRVMGVASNSDVATWSA